LIFLTSKVIEQEAIIQYVIPGLRVLQSCTDIMDQSYKSLISSMISDMENASKHVSEEGSVSGETGMRTQTQAFFRGISDRVKSVNVSNLYQLPNLNLGGGKKTG
jgi:hypothetical protein